MEGVTAEGDGERHALAHGFEGEGLRGALVLGGAFVGGEVEDYAGCDGHDILVDYYLVDSGDEEMASCDDCIGDWLFLL